MMLPIIGTSEIHPYSWQLLVAWLGGIILFIGLLFELLAEKSKFRNARSMWHWHSARKIGAWVVILGVVIETVDAAWTAHDIRKAQQMADPLNKNIRDMSATVILIVIGTAFNDLTNWDAGRVARMQIFKTEKVSTQIDPLVAASFERNDLIILAGNPNAANSREYGIRFHSFNFLAFNGVETPVMELTNAHFVRLELNFLPRGARIATGGIDLVVNDSIHKQFQIFPQSDTNWPDGTVGWPYIAWATNVDNSPAK